MKAVKLNNVRNEELFALVDEEDYEMVTQHSWHQLKASTTYYARTAIKMDDGKFHGVLMHRMILDLKPGERGPDHINRCGWDNRRANLDMTHNSEKEQKLNRRNWGASQYRGVNKIPAGTNRRKVDKWRAYYYDGKNDSGNPRMRIIGNYDSDIEAAMAYDMEMLRLGRRVELNFPLGSL